MTWHDNPSFVEVKNRDILLYYDFEITKFTSLHVQSQILWNALDILWNTKGHVLYVNPHSASSCYRRRVHNGLRSHYFKMCSTHTLTQFVFNIFPLLSFIEDKYPTCMEAFLTFASSNFSWESLRAIRNIWRCIGPNVFRMFVTGCFFVTWCLFVTRCVLVTSWVFFEYVCPDIHWRRGGCFQTVRMIVTISLMATRYIFYECSSTNVLLLTGRKFGSGCPMVMPNVFLHNICVRMSYFLQASRSKPLIG